MISRFEWFVALRYLLAGKRHRFTSFISVMAVLGVAIGVCALIVVIAVMTGFQQELRDRLLGVNSHLIVQRLGGPLLNYQKLADEISTLSLKKEGLLGLWERLRGRGEVRVRAVLPCVVLQGLLSSAEGQAGVMIRGVPGKTAAAFYARVKMRAGSLVSLKDDSPHIVLGWRLARSLGLSPGDKVKLILPGGHATPFGLVPKIKILEVSGIFETGLYEFDATLAFVPLPLAQSLAGMRGVSHLEVKITDPFYAGKMADLLARKLGFPYWVVDWRRMNTSLFSALKLEKAAMFVILTLIVVVAAFNIVAALIMLVGEKREDIAVLKSMGASDASILKIFMLSGFLLGASGMFFGVLGGLFLCFLIARYPIIKLPSDVYYVDHLPVLVQGFDVVTIALAATILALLATIYPARQAAKLPPAEVLRYG